MWMHTYVFACLCSYHSSYVVVILIFIFIFFISNKVTGIPVHTMRAYEGVEVYLHAFWTSALHDAWQINTNFICQKIVNFKIMQESSNRSDIAFHVGDTSIQLGLCIYSPVMVGIHFLSRWIGRPGPTEWPLQSSNSTPCNFFLWGGRGCSLKLSHYRWTVP